FTVSPQIRLGAFRFGPSYGELEMAYRFLASTGEQTVTGFDGPGNGVLRSRLNLQIVRLDYAKDEFALGADTFLRWQAGLLLQACFFDNQLQTATLFEQARNSFYGAGPHAGLSISRRLGNEVCVYGRGEGALAVGYNTVQNFVVGIRGANNLPNSGSANQEESHISPSFVVEAGLAWKPSRLPTSTFKGGYQFMQWYNLGRVGDSRG